MKLNWKKLLKTIKNKLNPQKPIQKIEAPKPQFSKIPWYFLAGVVLLMAMIGRFILRFLQNKKTKKPIFYKHEIEHEHDPLFRDFQMNHISDPEEDFRINPIRKHTHSWKRFFKENKVASGVLGLAIVSFLAAEFFQGYSHLFKASLVDLKPIEFTGTVLPIDKVPNWVELSNTEYRSEFNRIPQHKLIPLPIYDPNLFQNGTEWGIGNEKARNAYVTYPVPFLGNYTLDGTENSGSHPAIDIKLPIGTPIKTIANGIVYKTGNETTGFGKYIVIAHVGMPDPDNPSQKTTLYSNYAHLSEIIVKEGEEVKKGQLIGKSGKSGLATAAHLHFQIDRADAPFHPYWPFTWKEASDAGYDFFSAVKSGFRKNNAQKYTIHPMKLIAQFDNYVDPNLVAVAGSSDQKPVDNDQKSEKQNTAPIPTPLDKIEPLPDALEDDKKAPETNVVAQNTQSEEKPADSNTESQTEKASDPKNDLTSKNPTAQPKVRLEFLMNQNFVPGIEKTIQIKADDVNLIAHAGIELSSTLRNKAQVMPQILTKQHFNEMSIAEIKVKTDSNASFKVIAMGDFGELMSPSLRAQVFTDVSNAHPFAAAINYLKQNDIIKGYEDGSFKPNGSINRAEGVVLILKANNMSFQDIPVDFIDVPAGIWFRKPVGTAVSEDIVKGYPDNTFKPGNTISRAEFLKVAILTAGFKPAKSAEAPYADVEKEAWFAPYFSFAKEHQLLDSKSGQNMNPGTPITRGEAANVIYKLENL